MGCFTAASLLLVFPVLAQKIRVADYQAKVYASWLGQCIGNVYGLPHENKYIDAPGPENWPYGYGPNAARLKSANGAFSDDDTDIEYLYLLAIEKYGIEPKLAQLAESWKYHVRDRVWLANRAALAAMHYGYTPPVTGARQVNPHWFQIDPQLINEIWAVTAPGMVRYAAAKSAWAARIMDDDWGIEPTIHYGAMYAAAFFESDVRKLIDIGVAELPRGSRFAKTVEEMKALHNRYPNDWKAARAEMARRYYHDEPADSKTIWNANLNGAAGILALLYGGGDFQKTLDSACAMGFDADNQAATMSGLIGLIVGREGLPNSLLFPFPELGWKEPLNDVYKNLTRFDMPDASLKDMAARMAKAGEAVILKHGGKRITEGGEDWYVINSAAEFTPPLELPAGPMPYIEVGAEVSHAFPVIGGKGPYRWRVSGGKLPPGLAFRDGRITGVAKQAGSFPVSIEVTQGSARASRDFTLLVRGRNLAPSASGILARVHKTDTAKRDAMWLTVPKSLYADSVDVIRDGKRSGDGSTFYSIGGDPQDATDYYGYEWTVPQRIGLIAYHGGSVEENGGWFLSLNAEYRDAAGAWKPVQNLKVTPPLLPGEAPFNKAHFIEYILTFDPVETAAIRIVGRAGGAQQRRSAPVRFTSITELGVYPPLVNHD
jgi:hypothetical protein